MNYYDKASGYHHIPNIRVPFFMMMAKDDPLIGSSAICYEAPKRNPHVILGVTERGGHLGYFESLASDEQWFTQPINEFFTACLKCD